jgi:hypothetical protein
MTPASGRWPDIATWAGPTVSEGDGDGQPGEPADRRRETRGVVIHIAEGTFLGTEAWQRNRAAQVSSTFVVDVDGTIAQMVDVYDRPWTQKAGNSGWISIEFAGHTPHPLTDAQLDAAARILAKAHAVFGVPLQVATSPDGRGLGHHSMGGVAWGHLDCPGPAIIAQKPAIVSRALAIVNGDDMDLTPANLDAIAHRLLTGRDLPADNPSESFGTAVLQAQIHSLSADSKLDGLNTKIDALVAAVHALAAGGTSVDTAAVIAAINAVGDRETQAVTTLRLQLAAAEAAAAAAFTAAP